MAADVGQRNEREALRPTSFMYRITITQASRREVSV